MDRAIVLQALRGYAEANEVVEAERIERLSRITPEQAQAISRDLQESWAAGCPREGLKRLDLWRVGALLIVRQAFEQMARAKGLI